MVDRGQDPGALIGDRAGELDERLQPAAASPLQPPLEQRDRGVGGESVDLAQLLFEQVGAVQWLVGCSISASFACWRSVRFSGFFQSANRAPFRSLASWGWPARRASFQTSRRTSSSASVASWITWNGSTQRTASGSRSAIGPAIHSPCRRTPIRPACSAPLRARRGTPRPSCGLAPRPPTPAARCRGRRRRSGSADPCGGRSRRSRSVAGPRADHLALRLCGDPLEDPADRPPADPHQLSDRPLRAVHRQPRALVFERPGEARPWRAQGTAQRRHRASRHPRRVGLENANVVPRSSARHRRRPSPRSNPGHRRPHTPQRSRSRHCGRTATTTSPSLPQ